MTGQNWYGEFLGLSKKTLDYLSFLRLLMKIRILYSDPFLGPEVLYLNRWFNLIINPCSKSLNNVR